MWTYLKRFEVHLVHHQKFTFFFEVHFQKSVNKIWAIWSSLCAPLKFTFLRSSFFLEIREQTCTDLKFTLQTLKFTLRPTEVHFFWKFAFPWKLRTDMEWSEVHFIKIEVHFDQLKCTFLQKFVNRAIWTSLYINLKFTLTSLKFTFFGSSLFLEIHEPTWSDLKFTLWKNWSWLCAPMKFTSFEIFANEHGAIWSSLCEKVKFTLCSDEAHFFRNFTFSKKSANNLGAIWSSLLWKIEVHFD
jgi:hypothetical protein